MIKPEDVKKYHPSLRNTGPTEYTVSYTKGGVRKEHSFTGLHEARVATTVATSMGYRKVCLSYKL